MASGKGTRFSYIIVNHSYDRSSLLVCRPSVAKEPRPLTSRVGIAQAQSAPRRILPE